MYTHPEFTQTLATMKMSKLAEETACWRLATAAIKAQQSASKNQPGKLNTLYTMTTQFLHKLSLPAWEAIVKHG